MQEKAHLCPSSVPENPSLMKTSGQQRVTRVYPSVAHPPPSISLSLHLFSPSITLSAQSVLLLSRQWLYSAQLKSNHHYPFLSLQPSIPFCPPPSVHLLFSVLSFFVLCQVLFQGTSCDPCSPTSSPLRQALGLFLMSDGKTRGEGWLKTERRQINQRSHFHCVFTLQEPNTKCESVNL